LNVVSGPILLKNSCNTIFNLGEILNEDQIKAGLDDAAWEYRKASRGD
jgi:hypothetical protein